MVTALHGRYAFRLAKLHLIAAVAALLSVFGLIAVTSSTSARLGSEMQGESAALAAISQRAAQIQAFARNIHKASHTVEPEMDLPFGGFVGPASQVEPGAQLSLGAGGVIGHVLEVVSARKVDPSIKLTAAMPGKIDLMVVTGRVIGAPGSPFVRILVAVAPVAPTRAVAIDQQTL